MTLEWIREYCLSLPHATEKIQWQIDLLFCIGGKMFLVANTEPGTAHKFSFKCSEERFHELLEREGVIPAPYLARAKWVAVKEYNTLEPAELREYIREGYELIRAKLPKKVQAELGKTKSTAGKKTAAKKRTSRRK